MFADIAQLVLKEWNSEAIRPNHAIPANDVLFQFQFMGVNATTEILEVFSHLNGFDDGSMDRHCINFWSMDKIKLEKQRNSDLVEFADFLIDSHRYGFKVEPNHSVGIYVVYDEDASDKVAGSFREFFQLYLTDAEELGAFE
jgi:hypothetical protein